MSVFPAPIIQDVVSHDMCVACGACVQICPRDNVTPAYNPRTGAVEVRLGSTETCHGCYKPCDTVCPSIAVDLVQLLADSEVTQIPRAGVVRAVYTGYAPACRDNGVSSSGGILRAIISSAVREGTPVICLGHDGASYRPMIHRSEADLGRVPGSIYHSIGFHECIELLRQLETPCVLVAISCHLEGVEKYIQVAEPELADKIALRAGIICGWMFSDHTLRSFMSYKALEGDVIDARYRGEDKVGRLKIWTEHGFHSWDRRVFPTPQDRVDYKASFARYLNRLRCRVCEDHVNVLADVSVGDAWLKRSTQQKLSVLVVRTERGEALVERLERTGVLKLEEGGVEDVYESQSANLVEGHDAQRLGRFLSNTGLHTPDFHFGDCPEVQSSPARDAVEFAFEMVMRSVARAGLYKLYRSLYQTRDVVGKIKRRVRRLGRSS